ncbi:hypothetical protein RRG08_032757 [Elysia crispata]|uniref:Uncharacterized protein n=1 Tax=Elysia crispata TaxID=231223 RepID=A0AAE1D2G7_9GAST|nr:hypothetical protein RRG08_032757 [Elysia crispata]
MVVGYSRNNKKLLSECRFCHQLNKRQHVDYYHSCDINFIPPENFNSEMLEEFIAVDDDAPVTGELTDGEIVLKTLERKQT